MHVCEGAANGFWTNGCCARLTLAEQMPCVSVCVCGGCVGARKSAVEREV
jgi:hypothetical protein